MPDVRHWLIKSEPGEYSIDDLQRDKRTCWDGVRNYAARNHLRDGMKRGDLVLFYHSSAEPTGVAGVARVCREAYADHTAQERTHAHYDAKSTRENPIWLMVDVEFVEKFPRLVTLEALKDEPALAEMMVTQRGQRPSVQPVTAGEFERVLRMGRPKQATTTRKR